MKTFKLHSTPVLVLTLLLVGITMTTCFSPLDYKGSGDTTLRVSLPGGTVGARTAVTPEDLRYELHFSGPGGRTAKATAVYGETVTVKVTPGTWTVSVWAYDSAGNPKAVGEAYNIDVQAGKENNVPIKMAVYTEVSTWAGLEAAITTGTYDEFIVVKGNIAAPTTPPGLTLPAKKITITGENRTIGLSAQGSLFTVSTNAELVLRNITLEGISGNNAPLVRVNTNGKLVLHSGGKITENTYSTSTTRTGGAGVYMDGGTLEIVGGEISGNTVTGTAQFVHGGGVYAVNGSNVVMTGGVIRGNNITNSFSGNTGPEGGGISLFSNSKFEMSGGFIENNTVNDSPGSGMGGACGGGASVNENSFFYFKGGTIRDNVCHAVSGDGFGATYGGGVFVGDGCFFIMSGGVINGNTCSSSIDPNSSYGTGGMYIDGAYGGGVGSWVNSGTIIKTNGVIYGDEVSGNDANGISLKNTAHSDGAGLGGGHAVFVNNGLAMTDKFRRNTTSYANNNMNSSVSGPAGGWE